MAKIQRPKAHAWDTRLANVIAIVFLPPASSAYVFFALSLATGIERGFWSLLVAIFFASFVEMVSFDLHVRRSGRDPDVREERAFLFVGAIVSYLVGFLVLRSLAAPFIISALMFAYFVNTTFAAIITKYATKVSIHTWGITGPSVTIFYSFGVIGLALMLTLGAFVGTTRVKLGVHTWKQVTLSFLVSIPLTWAVVYVIPMIFPGLFGPA